MKKLLAALTIMALFAPAAYAAETIKLGAFFDLSGRAAFIGTPTKLVAEMAVEKINAEGGINGQQLELIIADTEANPAKSASIAKKFIHKDGVVAIIGPTLTDTGMNVKKVVEDGQTPTFMTVGGDPVIMGGKFGSYKYVFKSPQRSSIAVERLFIYLKEKGLTRVALLSAADGFGKDGARWMEKLAPEYGIEIIASESFGTRDTDMTAQLTKVKNADPQAIIAWTIGPAGSIIAKNKVQLGIDLPLFQCHGLPDPKYIELAGAASEGDRMPATKLMIVNELPDSDPQKEVILEFVKLYTEKGYAKQFPINTHSGYAWDAIMMVADAMKKVGTDKEALRNELEATKNYVGISGTYNITAEDHNGLDVDSMVMVEVKDGTFTLAK
jgi:branched-chain amino acid transport system substrate-binding protein